MSSYFVDKYGYYGRFGGAFIPEMLQRNISELQNSYRAVIDDPEFQREFSDLLRNYVGRPNPLYLARRLSDQLGFHVYLKREDLNHTGAHKINNTIGQILLAKRLGRTRVIAETGAGQHGVATATVCALMGIECIVYMGELDIERQYPNVRRMEMLGAKVVPVSSGSRVLKDATNEAMRDWIAHPDDTHYIIGSVVGPHPFPDMVAGFQSVISAEIKEQLPVLTGQALPDFVVACVGGGSNAIGGFYHFLDREEVKLIGVEAAGCGLESGRSAATLSLGRAGVLHGSSTYLMQDQDGQVLEAHSLSAGLDYPGIGPQHAYLKEVGRVSYQSVTDQEALAAAAKLARFEGIIPALESAHALAYLEKLHAAANQIVIVILSGGGDKDMATYQKYYEDGAS